MMQKSVNIFLDNRFYNVLSAGTRSFRQRLINISEVNICGDRIIKYRECVVRTEGGSTEKGWRDYPGRWSGGFSQQKQYMVLEQMP